MHQEHIAKFKIMTSMLIFGTIGLFVRHVSMPSSVIAFVRGVVGVAFLLFIMKARHIKLNWKHIRKNIWILLLSGTGLGFNWILLFESYRFTTVAVSTLCYYMAPILVVLLSPVFLKERFTLKKVLCVLAALIGMVLVSGLTNFTAVTRADLKGIIFGLSAAMLYAIIVLMNKQLNGISSYDRTVVQLSVSAITLIPYCLLTVPVQQLQTDSLSIATLLVLGVLHTGLPYYLYFDALNFVSGQSAAIISYIDPVVAVLISVLILREPMLPTEMIGAAIIIAAAFISEMPSKGGSV